MSNVLNTLTIKEWRESRERGSKIKRRKKERKDTRKKDGKKENKKTKRKKELKTEQRKKNVLDYIDPNRQR